MKVANKVIVIFVDQQLNRIIQLYDKSEGPQSYKYMTFKLPWFYSKENEISTRNLL